jgi:hypothetical protein
MNWPVIVVLVLLVGYIVSETVGGKLKEGFAVPRRSDIGRIEDGWAEEAGYVRDLRYTEGFTDIQGHGVAADFCRAVARRGDPDSLHIACALGTRDGMDTMEYKSMTLREGFRMSRDDYFRAGASNKGRMDYCRILKDRETGEWHSSCAIAGRTGFKADEERDTIPPPAIRDLLEAYDGILTWFRWVDDEIDYAENADVESHGRAEFPSLLRPVVSRGLQLNRHAAAARVAHQPAPPLRDYLRWGEKGALTLDQAIPPRQIRAISFWIWWDAFEKGARVIECSGGGKKDLMWLGVEGGGHELVPARAAGAAQELRPDVIQSVGQLTEPAAVLAQPLAKAATYVFEIWDEEQRLMRLASPMGSARTDRWQHVAVTVTDGQAWWPTWQMWIDGNLVATKTDGRLSPALELTQNFIGRGVRGCIQDFRVYSKPLTEDKLQTAIAWGRPHLHPLP